MTAGRCAGGGAIRHVVAMRVGGVKTIGRACSLRLSIGWMNEGCAQARQRRLPALFCSLLGETEMCGQSLVRCIAEVRKLEELAVRGVESFEGRMQIHEVIDRIARERIAPRRLSGRFRLTIHASEIRPNMRQVTVVGHSEYKADRGTARVGLPGSSRLPDATPRLLGQITGQILVAVAAPTQLCQHDPAQRARREEIDRVAAGRVRL